PRWRAPLLRSSRPDRRYPALAHGSVPLRSPLDPHARASDVARSSVPDDPRAPRAQPEGGRCGHPARTLGGPVRGLGERQVDDPPGDPLPGGAPAPRARTRHAGTPRFHRGDRRGRPGPAHRPSSHRADPPVESGHVHRCHDPDPGTVRGTSRGEGAGVRPRTVQLQRRGGTVRDVRGRRGAALRDALPRGRPRHVGERGARLLRAPPANRDEATAPGRRGARVHPARAERDHAFGRGSAADQDRLRAREASHRQDPLPLGRADDRPPFRRRRAPARSTVPAALDREHGGRHRAQRGRAQVGRLVDRPRSRGRERGRARGRPRAPRGGGAYPRLAHRPVPPPASSAAHTRVPTRAAMSENHRPELPSFVPASQLAAETREGFRRGPDVPGVYLFRSGCGEVVYVGKARSLRRRVLDHLRARIEKDGTILAQSASVEFVPTVTEREALLLEANLVKQYQPPYNVLLKDDRSYPYLAVTVGEEVPRILLVRRPRRRPGLLLFGPYTSAREARGVEKLLGDLFQLRRCVRLPKQAC